jgi:hypothetical protein
MLRFKAFSIIRFLVLGSVFLLSPLHAQDLRQWMPNVGDKFIYLEHSDEIEYWHGVQNGFIFSSIDTLYMEIVSIDSNYDSTHAHVVVVREFGVGQYLRSDTTTVFYYFHAGSDSGSLHPFATTVGNSFCSSCNDDNYDFSIAADTEITFGANQLSAFSFQYDSIVNSGGTFGSISSSAIYSPQLHWFCYLISSDNEPPPDETYTESSDTISLLYASNFQSKVEELPTDGTHEVIVNQSGNLLNLTLGSSGWEPSAISLLDLLGRPIRSWLVPVDAGERQISLNVADVQSGVYFLQVSAPGVEEMRKLVIVH